MKNQQVTKCIITTFTSLFVLSLLMPIQSCKTVKFKDLEPVGKNEHILPALEIGVDGNSLESSFSRGITHSEFSTTSFGHKTSFGFGSGTSTHYADARVRDINTIFDREVKNNITNPFTDKKGTITCNIVAGGGGMRGYGYQFFSGLTLFVFNLFGMPCAISKTSLEIEVEIHNLNKKLIGRYTSRSSQKEIIALYYGYNWGSGNRITAINAFKKCMADIKHQIDLDYPRLIKELN